MRIALCISGQPRFVETAYKNLQQTIIAPNNPDIFIHTWYDKSMVGEKFTNYNASNWDYSSKKSEIQDGTDDLILNLYKPKKFLFEKQRIFTDTVIPLDKIMETHAKHYTRDYYVNMLYSSWYSIQQANLLKEQYRLENNIQYDYAIRVRFDSTLNAIIDCSKFNPNYLYTDKRWNLPQRMIEDWFAFGSNKIMNIYGSGFNFIQHFVDVSNTFDGIFCSETIVYELMRHFGIKNMKLDGLIHTPIRQNMV